MPDTVQKRLNGHMIMWTKNVCANQTNLWVLNDHRHTHIWEVMSSSWPAVRVRGDFLPSSEADLALEGQEGVVAYEMSMSKTLNVAKTTLPMSSNHKMWMRKVHPFPLWLDPLFRKYMLKQCHYLWCHKGHSYTSPGLVTVTGTRWLLNKDNKFGATQEELLSLSKQKHPDPNKYLTMPVCYMWTAEITFYHQLVLCYT